MGRAKLRLKRIELDKFDKGFFPNQDFDDVPDGGSSDCKHVFYKYSALRPFPGMDLINSSAASEIRGNGIHYFEVNGITKRVSVFGNKFYEDVDGTWTDRTGSITITDGTSNLVQFVNHQAGSNKWVIGMNGVDAPFKWTGSGNASVLGGSPPIFESGDIYHNTFFGSIAEKVYFSDTTDPETYNTSRWVIPFERDIKRVISNDTKLAVLMQYGVGSISGYDFNDFIAEHNEAKNVGCVGRLAACKAFFGKNKNPVIATVSYNGLWLIDQAFGVQQLFGQNYFNEFNAAALSKASVAYCDIDRLLYVTIPYGSATESDYLIIVDMETGAFWPGPSIHANSIRAMCSARDANNNEFIYFVDTNGYAFKFNTSTKNYHTGTASQAIDSRWKSKKYDLKDVHDMRWAMLLAAADGDWDVTMAVAFGLSPDDGSSSEISLINLEDDVDVLSSTFILGASVLGGSNYVFKVLEDVGGFGRYLTITFTHSELDETFNIKKAELQLKRRRMGSNDK